ncbi:hypothetical protein [Nonomuraea sp. SYSU D8015]|uniref:hypothetical protein n=1 Tax=Nonomuraea sp. SYSU D8015 TaxID=2593644 RepID=UPI001661170C|nr:hypothetical protein [Nonomuraea sp. SYSU D8015]
MDRTANGAAIFLRQSEVPSTDVRGFRSREDFHETDVQQVARGGRTVITMMMLTGAAHAADTAYNAKPQQLTAFPRSGLEPSTVEREIWLRGDAAGYGWFIYVQPNAISSRNNYTGFLSEVTYRWIDKIVPGDGFYSRRARLLPRSNNRSAGPRTEWRITCTWSLSSDGTYTWRPALDPHF